MIRSPRTIARVSIEGGLVAGIAMMPFGAVLRALGYQVNVYGELMVRALLGSAPMLAQLVFHVVVSITLAIPFVVSAAGERMVKRSAASIPTILKPTVVTVTSQSGTVTQLTLTPLPQPPIVAQTLAERSSSCAIAFGCRSF